MIRTMKQAMILFAAATIFFVAGCTQPKPADMLKDDAQKREMFSAILNNDQASSELMDSLMTKRHEQMMTKMQSMMMADTSMQKGMMDKMMAMSNNDSSMCKMMMGSMQSQPKVMKSMEGMCDMKGMNGMRGMNGMNGMKAKKGMKPMSGMKM